MNEERRRTPRVPCRIPATGPAGLAVIEDMSAVGARVRAASPVRVGQPLRLELRESSGRRIRLAGAVRRMEAARGGYVLGCSFEADAASSLAAWKLTRRIGRPSQRFAAPEVQAKSAARKVVWDHVGIGTLAAVLVGGVLVVLGSLLALGYFVMGH